jgi:hypothetical protein
MKKKKKKRMRRWSLMYEKVRLQWHFPYQRRMSRPYVVKVAMNALLDMESATDVI